MLGYEEDEIGTSMEEWSKRVHPDDLPQCLKDLDRHFKGETPCYSNEHRVRCKDGSYIWILDRGKVIQRTEDGKPLRVIGTHTNINDRKLAENIIQTLSLRQEAILAAVPDIVMEVDANKVYTWANQAGYDFFGPDVLGKEAEYYFEGEQKTYQLVKPLFDGDESVTYLESWQRRKDGQKRLLAWWCRVLKDEKGRARGALSTARDITARKKAEDALKESEQKFRALFENMAEGVALHEVLYDTTGKAMDYRILDVNPAYEMHTGLAREKAQGALASQLYGTGAPPYLSEGAKVANGGAPYIFETYFAPLSRHFSISVISPKLGQFATVFEDITARIRREEELKQRNAELTQFTYMVSHDLKSPLVTVKTFLGYLEEDLSKADAGRIAKDMIFMRTAAEKMERLLDELLDMSRLGRVANPPARSSFRDLVTEALGAVAGPIAKRKAATRVDDVEVSLLGDCPRLVEIWQNLLENAVKYMGDQPSPRIEIGAEGVGRDRVFFVRDNGMGIDPKYHEKVFGLFEKLDSNSEGTGLGLALVRRIVELYQGKIWVESEGSGRGTCVRFTLPGALEGGGVPQSKD